MKLPKIDLASLPDLDKMSAVFGALRTTEPGHDDRIVIMATVVYESSHGGFGLF